MVMDRLGKTKGEIEVCRMENISVNGMDTRSETAANSVGS